MEQNKNLGKFRAIALVPRGILCHSWELAETFVTVCFPCSMSYISDFSVIASKWRGGRNEWSIYRIFWRLICWWISEGSLGPAKRVNAGNLCHFKGTVMRIRILLIPDIAIFMQGLFISLFIRQHFITYPGIYTVRTNSEKFPNTIPTLYSEGADCNFSKFICFKLKY